jgi:FixJ family two-component response regulator
MSKTLYILDDESDFAHMLAEHAQNSGWDVTVNNESKSFLEKGLPSAGVLVLDLIMPDMDGIEVIQGIASAGSELGLILVSGFDYRVLESARLLAEAHGITVHGCLEKPVPLEQFSALLEKARSADNL